MLIEFTVQNYKSITSEIALGVKQNVVVLFNRFNCVLDTFSGTIIAWNAPKTEGDFVVAEITIGWRGERLRSRRWFPCRSESACGRSR